MGREEPRGTSDHFILKKKKKKVNSGLGLLFIYLGEDRGQECPYDLSALNYGSQRRERRCLCLCHFVVVMKKEGFAELCSFVSAC